MELSKSEALQEAMYEYLVERGTAKAVEIIDNGNDGIAMLIGDRNNRVVAVSLEKGGEHRVAVINSYERLSYTVRKDRLMQFVGKVLTNEFNA